MNIAREENRVESVWQQIRPFFTTLNGGSDKSRSWENTDLESFKALDEYFWGSSYRFSLLLSILRQRLPESSKVLDAGSGHGILAAALQAADFDTCASDLHEGLPVFEHLNIPYAAWHLEAEPAPYPDHTFDAVVLSQTIEHFTYSPLQPMKEIIRIVKPGGLVLIDAPNISSFHNFSKLIRGKTLHWSLKKHYLEQSPEMVNGIPYYDRHNREYSMQDMRELADHFGLKLELAQYYSSYNRRKRGRIAVLASRIRDSVRPWRKSILGLFKVTE
ncbi:MAG: class I SAM-dependent methyltransferase [Mariprofundaceae bacterium]